MERTQEYRIDLSVLHGHHEAIDIPAIVEAGGAPWWNKTLTEVNESVVRLGVIEGDFHWHKHDAEDEFFLVLEGHLFIDLEDRTIELRPQQGTTIGKGVMHRPRAVGMTVILMVESKGIVPTGDGS